MNKSKAFRVKILDFSYLADFEHLDFQYIFYDIEAENENDAKKKARNLYMNGEKGVLTEKLPFLFKIVTVVNSH